MPDAELVAFLATAPLLEGIPQPELEQVATLLRPRRLNAGEVLWREGEEALAMLLIVTGRVSVTLRLPGDRSVEVTSLGPGDVLGEIPLLDGGRQSATAQVAEPSTVLSLSRADFASLVSRRHPTASMLKRRIAALACARLRGQLASLAAPLGEVGQAEPDAQPPVELEWCGAPNSRYVRRLANFHAFDSLALWGFLTAGRYARVPAGRTLVAEGARSDACYLTINGAVEKLIVRGSRRVRVGLAGPGLAFGYESLIDGLPSPATATTRERTLLLVLPRAAFERLFGGEEAGSHVFLDVIHRDLTGALRQALRPHAWQAASVQPL